MIKEAKQKMAKLYNEKPCCFKEQCKEKDCDGFGRWIAYQHGRPQQVECYSYIPQMGSEEVESELEVLACQGV